MTLPRSVSRRALLRGAGVAIGLPWLESLVGPAQAQSATGPQRFVAIYLPNGAPEFWSPPNPGSGNGWQLSSVLDLLQPLKAKVTVISGLENGSVFNADGSNSVEPAHGRLPGAWLTCTDPGVVRRRLNVMEASGISVDQIMAAQPAFAGQTALPSMQIGLTSWKSYCDGQPCSNVRSVSWETETKPLYKLVDPRAVFDRLMGVWPPSASSSPVRDQRLSVLDAVKETTAVTRARLSASDKLKLDEFLESVRSVEQRVVDPSLSCGALAPLPDFPIVTDQFQGNTGGYNKGVHADLMNELLALALQCDRSRIVTYMLEDERTEFICDHIPLRTFTPLGSAPSTGVCGEWHGGGQEGGDDMYGSIVRWNVGKVAELCQRLDSMPEGAGRSVLDNSVIFLGSATHGHAENADRLPSLVVGSGGGALQTDQHVDLGKRPMRDFYYTLMNRVYDLNIADFGVNLTGAPLSIIDELLSS